MDQDVAATLGALERKLGELERTLAAISAGQPPPIEAADDHAEWPHSGSRVVDETIEPLRPASVPFSAGATITDPAPLAGRTPVTPSATITDAAQPWRPDSAARAAQPPAAIPGQAATPRASAGTAAPPPPGPPPADFEPAPVGGAAPASDLPSVSAPAWSPSRAASSARRASGPATRPPTRAPTRASTARPPSTAELLGFRERLEEVARELTHDYDELLGRLSYAAVPAAPGQTISFARGVPSLDIIDVQGLRDAALRAFDSDPGGLTAYGTSVGYPRLRAWIADHHGVEPERVFVTNGSLQADAFLFDQLVHEGDDVIVESPTYDRTLLSLRRRGANVYAVALEPDGIDTDALGRLLGSGVKPKLAHVIPNFQNPAGYTLSLAKRQALLALAAQHGFLVLEDDPYVDLRFSGEPIPTMLSLDPDRVVYASSFTKTVCPGVRVGYLVGPRSVIDAIVALATNTYISPGMVSEGIVYEFCASGAIDRSIETVRTALAERAATLGESLRRELPDAEFVAPQGGYFMWVTLPAGTDVNALFDAAGERGVTFVKGSDFLLEGGENTLRLAYSGVTSEEIEEGVSRLASAYRSL